MTPTHEDGSLTQQVCLVQWALRRHPEWRIPERNKAFVLCADLAAAMAYIMLLRDLDEVPGGTHDWMLSCHGWGILFLQVWLPAVFIRPIALLSTFQHLNVSRPMALCTLRPFTSACSE